MFRTVTYLRLSEVVFFTFYYQDITIIAKKGSPENIGLKTGHPLEFSNESCYSFSWNFRSHPSG